MARPRKMEKGIPVTLWLDEPVVAEIDRLADQINLSRSRFIRNLVASGLQDAKLMDMMGLFKLMKKIEKGGSDCTLGKMAEA